MIEAYGNGQFVKRDKRPEWEVMREVAERHRSIAIQLESDADRLEREWNNREAINAALTAEYGPSMKAGTKTAP